MFSVFLPFTRYRDLIAHSSRFRGILVIFRDFWVILVILEHFSNIGELRGFGGFFLGHFVVLVILGVQWPFL